MRIKRPSQGKTLNGLCPDELFYSKKLELLSVKNFCVKIFSGGFFYVHSKRSS